MGALGANIDMALNYPLVPQIGIIVD